MQYSVAFNNISENDQLVLRLIFSLSAKAKGRSHAYCLFESDINMMPDICITPAKNKLLGDLPDSSGTIWLGEDDPQSEAGEYTIRKPLIASRVLNVLDSYIRSRQVDREQPLATPEPEEIESSTDSGAAVADEPEFCISEEEASQLAIVEDEVLSNPANLSPADNDEQEKESESRSDDITTPVASLIVRHNNKEMEVSAQAFATRQQEQLPGKRPRALVVDDSPSVRKQIELELQLFDVDVDFAESLGDALNKLHAHQYDVAFLDVILPDGDGFHICKRIKSEEPETTVIMLTGKATAADKIRGSMSGCNAYLVKPVGRMTFQNTVCNYLKLREQLEVVRA